MLVLSWSPNEDTGLLETVFGQLSDGEPEEFEGLHYFFEKAAIDL